MQYSQEYYMKKNKMTLKNLEEKAKMELNSKDIIFALMVLGAVSGEYSISCAGMALHQSIYSNKLYPKEMYEEWTM